MTEKIAVPRRQRGYRLQEAAYRAGYLDGYNMGLEESARQREQQERREVAMQEGLASLQATTVAPRARRKRASGVDAAPAAVTT
jgi:hypothetical protein